MPAALFIHPGPFRMHRQTATSAACPRDIKRFDSGVNSVALKESGWFIGRIKITECYKGLSVQQNSRAFLWENPDILGVFLLDLG